MATSSTIERVAIDAMSYHSNAIRSWAWVQTRRTLAHDRRPDNDPATSHQATDAASTTISRTSTNAISTQFEPRDDVLEIATSRRSQHGDIL